MTSGVDLDALDASLEPMRGGLADDKMGTFRIGTVLAVVDELRAARNIIAASERGIAHLRGRVAEEMRLRDEARSEVAEFRTLAARDATELAKRQKDAEATALILSDVSRKLGLVTAQRDAALAWADDDRALPEDAAIHAAHPMRTDRHDLYVEAMRMVGAKRSKGALVALVNWLLLECHKQGARASDLAIKLAATKPLFSRRLLEAELQAARAVVEYARGHSIYVHGVDVHMVALVAAYDAIGPKVTIEQGGGDADCG